MGCPLSLDEQEFANYRPGPWEMELQFHNQFINRIEVKPETLPAYTGPAKFLNQRMIEAGEVMREQIIDMLVESPAPMTILEIARELNRSDTAIRAHIKMLQKAGRVVKVAGRSSAGGAEWSAVE